MRTEALELDRDMVAKAYDRWAPVYDMVFGPVFERGRRAAIAAAERTGGRILEVGVGTGISLPDYSPRNRIFGVDISEMMLRKARERVSELGLDHVEGLAVMDAGRLDFADAAFDVVVAQYVITAVPDPEGTLDEFARVLKPGCGARWSIGSRRPRASSAGAPSSPGSATPPGPRARQGCGWSNVAPCRRSDSSP